MDSNVVTYFKQNIFRRFTKKGSHNSASLKTRGNK